MSVNWPDNVTDATAVPAAVLVPAKKWVWLSVAIEKMRHLHNGIQAWARGEALTPEQESVVAEEFAPGNWPFSYPADTPTLQQARDWIDTHWQPRSTELQTMRGQMRTSIPLAWYGQVDLHNVTT